jgi:hypothetical protein
MPCGFPVRRRSTLRACPDILGVMREAYFTTVSCGIETPELGALDAIEKSHNMLCHCSKRSRRLTARVSKWCPGLFSGSTPTFVHQDRPDRLHRSVPYPGLDDQPAASSAEDTLMGSARHSRSAQTRWRYRIECRLRTAIRGGAGELAHCHPPCFTRRKQSIDGLHGTPGTLIRTASARL